MKKSQIGEKGNRTKEQGRQAQENSHRDQLDDQRRQRHMGHGDQEDDQGRPPKEADQSEQLGRPGRVGENTQPSPDRTGHGGQWDDKSEGTSRP